MDSSSLLFPALRGQPCCEGVSSHTLDHWCLWDSTYILEQTATVMGLMAPPQIVLWNVYVQGLLKPSCPLGALSFKAQCFKIQTQHQNQFLLQYWLWMLPDSRLRQGWPTVTRAMVLYLGLLHWYSGKLIFLYCIWSLCGDLYLKFSEHKISRTKIPNSPKLWQMPTNL